MIASVGVGTAGLVVLVVVVALAAGALGAWIVARRVRPPASTAASEPAGQELQRAVDTLVGVASEQLDQRVRSAAAHVEGRKELIDAELARLATTVGRVDELLQDAERRRSTQYGQLAEQLQGVARQHAELGRTTGALREALTSSQARGQWGERMAVDVLRAAGFVEGVNYRTQVTTRSGTRPDVTFLLPGDRVVHMDVKFPLGRYLDMLEAPGAADRDLARRDFLKAVRARVKEIADRGYVDEQDGTVDCVLLFIPNEQVYGFVHEQDPTLLDDALAQRVVVCAPSTLFAVLAVIRAAVDAFTLERTSDEILQVLAGFRDQWGRFTDQLDKLGRGLETTQRAYDALTTTRRGQLERQLDRIDEVRSRRGVEAVLAEDASARLVAFPPPREVEEPEDTGEVAQGADHTVELAPRRTDGFAGGS
ncbi:MAG: DNA recombination protein RmuC [Nitriliruptoraceae bacterium]|nr:DNA recombination protein RmuC [Nitriliruptoraceae bacterium]